MTPEQLKERIETLNGNTSAEIMDLTGTQDHYKAIVVSAEFEGKSLIQQHQLVYGTVKDEMASGEVHALSLKTMTPEQYKALG